VPHPEIEKLDKNAAHAQKSAARSACIEREIHNGKDPKQAEAMCYQMVRDKSGGD